MSGRGDGNAATNNKKRKWRPKKGQRGPRSNTTSFSSRRRKKRNAQNSNVATSNVATSNVATSTNVVGELPISEQPPELPSSPANSSSEEGEEEEEEVHVEPTLADSPSKNTRSKTRPDHSDDDSDVDEELHLNQLEEYYEGKKKPTDQLYRKVDKTGRIIFTKDEHRQRRMAIHYYFTATYGSPPEDTGLWGGKDGIAVRIRNSMMLRKTQSSTNNVMKTMRSVSVCNAMNKPYCGERDQHKPYEQYYIKTTDFEAQLTADLIEAGIGFTETTDEVNEWRRANDRKLPNGQTDVGRSCVHLASKRLAPKVTVIKKRPQGSLNKESNWCKASHRWACQMLIMLGELKKDSEIPKKFCMTEGLATSRLPDCFRMSIIKKVDIKCCVHGDESHKKTRKGSVRGGTKIEHRCPRDEFGTLDFSENGKYAVRGTELNMKCTKEARFSLFMCLKLDEKGDIMYDVGPDGEKLPLGKVLEAFECAEKKMMSNPDHKQSFNQVMKAPKNAAKKGPWCNDNRVEGAVYEGDPVAELPNIGEKAGEFLAALDPPITTVKQYYDYFMYEGNLRTGMNRRKNFGRRCGGMTYNKATTAMNAAERAIAGDPPAPTDYRAANNPCLARWPIKEHGPKKWVEEVENTATMRKFVNVRELVKHVIRMCEEEFEGTQFQDTWGFNHDALSLMCSKDCIEWMNTQGYLKRWALPQHQLNEMFAHYDGRPIGNHPKAMPWDQSSNWDHDLIVLRHVAATSHLDEDDPRKLSLATPKKVSSAHRRIYNNPVVERDGEPLLPAGECGIPAYRLGHNILATIDYWWEVFDNEGLNQAVNVAGHRGGEVRDAAKEGRIKKTHGGPRTKKADKTDEESNWCHPDAKGEFEKLFKNSMKKFERKLKKVQEEHGQITQQNDRSGLDPDLVEAVEINNNNNNNDEQEHSNLQEEEEVEDDEGEETDYEDDDVPLALETGGGSIDEADE